MGYWEIELSGRWKNIGKVVGQGCNDAKGRGANQMTYTARGQKYLIDFPSMTQTNTRSMKARYIRERGAEVHVYPDTHPEKIAVAPAPAPDKPGAPAKPQGPGVMSKMVGGAGMVATGAVAAVGVALLAGAIDMGDITDAAEAAGEALGDIDMDDIGDALGEAGAAAADAAAMGADAAADAGAAAAAAAADAAEVLDLA